MTTFIADDFDSIAVHLRRLHYSEIEGLADPLWWCDDCGKDIGGKFVTDDALHDESAGGCGCRVHISCSTCRNEGWIDQRVGGHPITPWCECPDCHNPFKKRQP